MGHKTAKKKLAMSIMQTKEWLKKIRNKCRNEGMVADSNSQTTGSL